MDTGGGNLLYLLRFDPATGAITRDPSLPALDMSAVEVPGLGTVRGVPHGAVFAASRRAPSPVPSVHPPSQDHPVRP